MSPGIVETDGIDPVPAWRLKVWAAIGPTHRMMARDRAGRYVTVFHTEDKNAAARWWEAVKHREGTAWKDWTWLAYYRWTAKGATRQYGISRLMVFPQ